MKFRGHISQGHIVVDEDIQLPEGAEVDIEIREAADQEGTLADILGDVIGAGTGLPPDFAEQHDHYLYGTPKK